MSPLGTRGKGVAMSPRIFMIIQSSPNTVQGGGYRAPPPPPPPWIRAVWGLGEGRREGEVIRKGEGGRE